MAKLDAAGIYQEPEVEGLVTDYVANKGNNTLIKMGHPRHETIRCR
jgi:type I restriction enzyme R subunit